MMEVQKYLQEHGIEKLKEEFNIKVREYEDLIVANYSQIDSPRFHPICDECRGLILEKDTWKVLARSFNRFYNYQENLNDKDFPIVNSNVQQKIDGSIITVWKYKGKWNASSRSMAFAEGETAAGITFANLFWGVANRYQLKDLLDLANMDDFCLVFELTSPITRIVTPYPETDITLIGGRYLGLEKDELQRSVQFRELSITELDNLAIGWKLKRPKSYQIDGVDSLLNLVNGFECMQEGVVLVIENANGSHWRLKVKNPKYLAIAHMRENGNISPKRILTLIMANEQAEYLNYFAMDKPYFDFVEAEYKETIHRMKTIYKEVIGIEDQKEFALTMMPKVVYSFEKGVLFSVRKNGGTVEDELSKIEPKKIAQSMDLRGKFSKKFGIETEEEE